MSSSSKQKIIRCFNRAATSYSKAAVLQNLTGDNLLRHLNLITLTPKIIADLGAGTGAFSRKLNQCYPHATGIVTIDLAEKMLRVAQRNIFNKNYCWLADFDYLPLATNSIDLIYSNLALQWSVDLTQTLTEFRRILQPNAYLAFTTLGSTSMRELHHCKLLLDANYKVPNWPTVNTLKKLLEVQQFSVEIIQSTELIYYFPDIFALARNLKDTGAFYEPHTTYLGLAGRHHLTQLQQHYAAFCLDQNQLPVTYEIIYAIARKL